MILVADEYCFKLLFKIIQSVNCLTCAVSVHVYTDQM